MPSDYDDDDDFDTDFDDEEGFSEEDGFSELDLDAEGGAYEDELEAYGDELLRAAGLDDEADADEADDPRPTDKKQDAADPFADLLSKVGVGAAGIGADDNDELAWRETYFVLFQRRQRPTLTQVEAAIGASGRRLTMENLRANDDGLFQSVLVQSPEDNAALEVSYEEGEAVMEQSAALAKQLQKQVDGKVLAKLLRADARLDIMHFERMDDTAPFDLDEPDDISLESLDPATLIAVVEALASLTGGLPIDPASGEVLI